MSNVTNNNFNELDLRISKSEYWDLVLSDENDPSLLLDGSHFYDNALISYIDMNDSRCISGNTLFSTNDYKWNMASNNGVNLLDFGFHGIDNGHIKIDKNNISSLDFINILTGSTFDINSGDTRLILNAVSGNTNNYVYPKSFISDLNGNYIKLDGGFYQGFFKSNNDYAIIPDKIQDEISFEFTLKPDFISQPIANTLNDKYINNKGIFFYIGIRNENKFWYNYIKNDLDIYTISKTGQTTPLDTYNGEPATSDGFPISSQNVYDINTDNNYLLINRTRGGLTASSLDSDVEYHITGVTTENLNYYNYVNRTATGYTGNSVRELSGLTKPYNVMDDVFGNAMAFIIKDNGSIGYRTINKYCNVNEDVYSIEEEYSEVNLIRSNELIIVNVRLIMSDFSECGDSDRKFKLRFYINGKLVFTSKYLPELLLRGYNDIITKEDSIPYNISIGGGSQGLCDMIGFNTGYTTQYLLPIEENFAGTFIGEFHRFRVYYGRMDYSKILNNFKNQPTKGYDPTYTPPFINFLVTGVSLNHPETNFKREIGNITSNLNANIELNDIYNPIIGYKLYYQSDSLGRNQINGLFNIPESGGSIQEYNHNDISLSSNGIKSITYIIEVLDTYNNNPGTEMFQTVIFDNMIFYGSLNVEPVNSDDIRLLPNKVFNGDTSSFTIQTGSINNVFVIAVPSTRTLFSVVDKTTFMLDITHLFNMNTMSVLDAGGRENEYNVYVMKNAIPYNRNHDFEVILN